MEAECGRRSPRPLKTDSIGNDNMLGRQRTIAASYVLATIVLKGLYGLIIWQGLSEEGFFKVAFGMETEEGLHVAGGTEEVGSVSPSRIFMIGDINKDGTLGEGEFRGLLAKYDIKPDETGSTHVLLSLASSELVPGTVDSNKATEEKAADSLAAFHKLSQLTDSAAGIQLPDINSYFGTALKGLETVQGVCDWFRYGLGLANFCSELEANGVTGDDLVLLLENEDDSHQILAEVGITRLLDQKRIMKGLALRFFAVGNVPVEPVLSSTLVVEGPSVTFSFETLDAENVVNFVVMYRSRKCEDLWQPLQTFHRLPTRSKLTVPFEQVDTSSCRKEDIQRACFRVDAWNRIGKSSSNVVCAEAKKQTLLSPAHVSSNPASAEENVFNATGGGSALKQHNGISRIVAKRKTENAESHVSTELQPSNSLLNELTVENTALWIEHAVNLGTFVANKFKLAALKGADFPYIVQNTGEKMLKEALLIENESIRIRIVKSMMLILLGVGSKPRPQPVTAALSHSCVQEQDVFTEADHESVFISWDRDHAAPLEQGSDLQHNIFAPHKYFLYRQVFPLRQYQTVNMQVQLSHLSEQSTYRYHELSQDWTLLYEGPRRTYADHLVDIAYDLDDNNTDDYVVGVAYVLVSWNIMGPSAPSLSELLTLSTRKELLHRVALENELCFDQFDSCGEAAEPTLELGDTAAHLQLATAEAEIARKILVSVVQFFCGCVYLFYSYVLHPVLDALLSFVVALLITLVAVKRDKVLALLRSRLVAHGFSWTVKQLDAVSSILGHAFHRLLRGLRSDLAKGASPASPKEKLISSTEMPARTAHLPRNTTTAEAKNVQRKQTGKHRGFRYSFSNRSTGRDFSFADDSSTEANLSEQQNPGATLPDDISIYSMDSFLNPDIQSKSNARKLWDKLRNNLRVAKEASVEEVALVSAPVTQPNPRPIDPPGNVKSWRRLFSQRQGSSLRKKNRRKHYSTFNTLAPKSSVQMSVQSKQTHNLNTFDSRTCYICGKKKLHFKHLCGVCRKIVCPKHTFYKNHSAFYDCDVFSKCVCLHCGTGRPS